MQTRVLMVDSNIAFIVRIKQALHETGDYDVSVFATGQAALEQVNVQPYDVAVVNVVLRDMDGIALIHKLRVAQPDMSIVAIHDRAHPVPPHTHVEGALALPYRARDLIPWLHMSVQHKTDVLPSLDAVEAAGADDDIEATQIAQRTAKVSAATTPGDALSFGDLFEEGGIGQQEAEEAPKPEGEDKPPRRGKTKELSPQELEEPPERHDAQQKPAPPPPLTQRLAGEAAGLPHHEAGKEAPPAEADESAQVALQLTHLVVQSPAEVMFLTRDRKLLGYAGDIRREDALDLVDTVYRHWTPGGSDQQTQVQFVRINAKAQDYILFSIVTEDQMVLSMAFPADTPLGQIRRQAMEIGQALQLEEQPEPDAVQETPVEQADEAPPAEIEAEIVEMAEPATPAVEEAVEPADETLPEVAAAPAEPVDETFPEVTDAPVDLTELEEPPAAEVVSMTSYVCAWAVRSPKDRMDDDQQQQVQAWLHEAATSHDWQIETAKAGPDYVSVEVQLPATSQPNQVVETLMDVIADRLAAAFPDRIEVSSERGIWADGYYIVTPARALTEAELARFISYQRREQNIPS